MGQTLVTHKARKAACAVAALLHLGAIGVVNDVFKVNTGAGEGRTVKIWSHRRQMTIRQQTVVRGGSRQSDPGLIEHHEIVAGHLCIFRKGDSHGGNYLRR